MLVSEMYPSRFMKAEDFDEGEVRIVTIKSVEMEELGQGKDKQSKPVVMFRDAEKQLVLNKTNAAVIAKLYGDDSDDWLGKKIALTVIEVESFGDVVRAIRVKTKAPAATPVLPTEEEFYAPPPLSDEVKAGLPQTRGVEIPSAHKAESTVAVKPEAKENGKSKMAMLGHGADVPEQFNNLLDWLLATYPEYFQRGDQTIRMRALKVLGGAGIMTFTMNTIEDAYKACQAHYDAKRANEQVTSRIAETEKMS